MSNLLYYVVVLLCILLGKIGLLELMLCAVVCKEGEQEQHYNAREVIKCNEENLNGQTIHKAYNIYNDAS